MLKDHVKLISVLMLIFLTGCMALPTPFPMISPASTDASIAATPAFAPTRPSSLPALTPAPTLTPPAWPTPNGAGNFLPAPLYYESSRKEEDGHQCPLPHIVRIERDGHTRTLIGPCFAYGLNGFDVSSVDGSIVLAAEGSLWRMDASSKNAKRLIEGLPDPELAGDWFRIQNPVWSPDGKQVAYADGGIRILNVASGIVTDVIKDKCYGTEELGTGIQPCFYGEWFLDPQWSPDGRAILIRQQTADYPVQVVFTLPKDNKPRTVPGTLGVSDRSEISWSRDGTALLFDYWWPANIAQMTSTNPAFVRVSRDDFSVQILWQHGDRADPVYASAGNNPWQIHYPFQAPDGHILFFQAKPCSTDSCYKYDLVEGQLIDNRFDTRVLRSVAELPDDWGVTWYDTGEFIAFAARPNHCYIGAMKVGTGETYLLAEEDKCISSRFIWGNPPE